MNTKSSIAQLKAVLKEAQTTLRALAHEAGDVSEWNEGGFAYETCRRIEKVLEEKRKKAHR